jgi:excisionase family DNA binding protein
MVAEHHGSIHREPKRLDGRRAYLPVEVARLTGLSIKAVRDLIRRKKLRACKVGPRTRVVSAVELDRFLAGAR